MKYMALNFIGLALIIMFESCSTTNKVEQFYQSNKNKDLALFYDVSITKRNDDYAINIYPENDTIDRVYFLIGNYPDKNLEILNTNQEEELIKYGKIFNIEKQEVKKHSIAYCYKIINEFNNLGKVIGLETKPKYRGVVKFYLTMEDIVYYAPAGAELPKPFKLEIKKAESLGEDWYYYKSKK